MKKILLTITALITLGFASCDESTPNPTENNGSTQTTKEDLLTSTLWERKYETEINRLEFNKGLLQQTFFLYAYYKPENLFSTNGDRITWAYSNDTITLTGSSGLLYTTKLKVLKLTQDTLMFERIGRGIDKFLRAPFEDTVSIHTYYRVK